ncbi:MAG: ABC transporter substrate binding protein [Alphaproteobacteria bacterium]
MGLARAVCAVAILCICAFPALGAEGPPARKRVLYISSYHPAFPSFLPQVEGIRSGLAAGGFPEPRIVLDFEYMDTKRFPKETQFPRFIANLRQKLSVLESYNVVIAADDNAFEMAVANQKELFRDAPIVFLGVNDRDAALRQNRNPRVTGVVEDVDYETNFGLIEHLYPKSGRIVAITDNTSIGALGRLRTAPVEKKLRNHRVEMLSLAELSYSEFFRKLAEVPPTVPVMLLSAYRDRNDSTGEFLDVLARIRVTYKGAVFANQRHGIGHGVLGGEVVDHWRQGLTAGQLTARILSGVPVSTLPVVDKSPNTLTIDFNEARRLQFNEWAFPPGTEFINRPVSYLSENRGVILVVNAVVFGQALAILLLIRSGRRSRIAEQAAIEARREAEIANKAKTEFLANMSHELRTPLNSVIGFAEVLIADRVGAIEKGKRAEYLSDIRESGQHLLDLLNNILDVAKIEMGKLQVMDAEIDVAHILRLCRRLVTERAAANNTRIELALPENLPRLRADGTRLKQSVLNLLSNAVKFSDGGGSVWISATMIGDGSMAISVRDDGPGIPAEDLKWVLEPFNRGRSSRVAAKEGSGIGLALTANLMQCHGGRLEIESEVGKGTTATLIFPPERIIAARRAPALVVNA